ncbi:MAG: helix-turn-helix transcriptional regulator [Planctomycetota bacterium]|nr:helix-turn-helix transcriptional regulator [Planctomycetota bacterium]
MPPKSPQPKTPKRERKENVRYVEFINYRIRQGWTLRDLSKISGLSPPTLSRLERGLYRPSMRTLVRLQTALGLNQRQMESLLSLEKLHAEREEAVTAEESKALSAVALFSKPAVTSL